METELHASFFGDGDDFLEKVLEVLPELLADDVGIVDIRPPDIRSSVYPVVYAPPRVSTWTSVRAHLTLAIQS